MKGRTLVIGDVHGCSQELSSLLKKLRPQPEDTLVSVGDLIGKGPDSRGVLEWAASTPNLVCVLGNHELRFLEAWKQGRRPTEKAYDRETLRQLGRGFDKAMRFLSSWPLRWEKAGLRVVHAGFDPRRALSGQEPRLMTNVRRLEDTGRPWYDHYKGGKVTTFGHWVRRKPLLRDNAIGIDTGCVYGGSLTALVWPERRLVSVRAKRVYVRRESWA
ncbi:MAG: metallophosphoesterase [Elusimicrobia bacterium]|nr:metallophosphoesterase [Elusimicrobiota bacterium]